MELVKLVEQKIGGELVQTVNARDLHAFLEVGTRYNDWLDRRIKEYEFREDVDFTYSFLSNTAKQCYLSLDMSKELAMVERNEKGRQARQYFIECEKRLKESSKPQTTLEIIAAQTQILIQQEREIAQLKDRVVRVEAKQQAFEEGFKYFTVLGYAAYKGLTVALSDAQTIGKQAAKLSRERNVPIDKVADQRFGRVNSYHESILDEIIANTL